jgi:hypothetical protein
LKHLPAATRAQRLMLLRLSPVVLGLLAAAEAMLAFLRHEPRVTVETPGLVLFAAAYLAVALAVVAGWRVRLRCRMTTRFLQKRTMLSSGWSIFELIEPGPARRAKA